MSCLRLEFDIDEPGIVKCIMNDDGKTRTKFVSFNDVVKLITGSVKSESVIDCSIPNGCYKIMVRKNILTCIFELPAQVRPVIATKSGNSKSYLVPYPRLLFVYTIDEELRRVVDHKVFSVKEGELWDGMKLYRFPFSNVNSDGSICLGGNNVNYVGDLKEGVKEFLDVFFVSPYNGDYYTLDQTGYLANSVDELFEQINGKEQFPEDMLVQTKYTIKELFNY